MTATTSILDNYPGAKGGNGVCQWLINHIPAHTVYYELFAGSAQLFRTKKPAEYNHLNDINFNVATELINEITEKNVTVYAKDIFDIIPVLSIKVRHDTDFIYLDPPYPKEARRDHRPIYQNEMLDEESHTRLLQLIDKLQCNVMISTRQNSLYSRMLKHWRKDTFQTTDRGGVCEEVIYMNYAPPKYLHQYNYLGNDYNRRQNVRRKQKRFIKKMHQLPNYERHLFIQDLIANYGSEISHFLKPL